MLIVDDNATNRLILEEMARNWGMLPTAASSAREALDALRHARQSGEPYRLLLSDVNMPETEGITLTEWIRQDSELADTTVIVLTSGARSDDLKRCEELGVAAHLMKPVKQSELFDAIGMSLSVTIREDEGEATLRGEQKAQLPSLHFLLAEDSLVNQKPAVALLEKHGHTVTVTNNGELGNAAGTWAMARHASGVRTQPTARAVGSGTPKYFRVPTGRQIRLCVSMARFRVPMDVTPSC